MSRKDYIKRINNVIDYIENHISEELSLEELARVAFFSPYHFHRIFTAFMDETLNHFIRRIRLEKAALRLLSGDSSITEIALDYGFSSSAVFARSFRENFGISATEWRNSKNCKTPGKIGKADFIAEPYNLIKNNRRVQMSVVAKNVEVREREEKTVAYVRYIGPYAGDENLFAELYGKLFKWAGPRGLLNSPDVEVLAVYHDDPELTDENKLRTSICVTVPQETETGGEIGKMTLPGGKFAMARFELSSDEFGEAWKWVCSEWLPDSGWEPADGPSFELSRNDASEHPEKKYIVDICIPVKPE